MRYRLGGYAGRIVASVAILGGKSPEIVKIPYSGVTAMGSEISAHEPRREDR